MEVSEPAQLAELAANKKIRPMLLGRLSDTVALVDPDYVHDLSKVLRSAWAHAENDEGKHGMSDTTVSLNPILVQPARDTLKLELMQTKRMKHALRFWVGVTESNRMCKEECEKALAALFKDRDRLAQGLITLPPKHRQILNVFRRYGGMLSGMLLKTELIVRQLLDRNAERTIDYGRARQEDPVFELCDKLFLDYLDSYAGRRAHSLLQLLRRAASYPNLSLHPALVPLTRAAPPLP